jgi:hypothetical protein
MVTLAPSACVTHEGKSYKLFFLRGHMRSGTNWVGALLNLHPRVYCKGEYHFERLAEPFETWARYHEHRETGADVVAASRECLQDTVRRCLAARIPTKPDADWQGDRTPHVIDRLLPGAPTVYVLRDGRDVVVSRLFHTIRAGHVPGPGGINARGRFRDAEHYAEHPTELLADEEITRFMARSWAESVARDAGAIRGEQDDVLLVRYESLRAEPETGRGEMYRFFGLDPAQAEPLNEKDKTTPGFDRGEDASSFYRAGVAGGWRKYFTPDATRWFKEEAHDALTLGGYESNAGW